MKVHMWAEDVRRFVYTESRGEDWLLSEGFLQVASEGALSVADSSAQQQQSSKSSGQASKPSRGSPSVNAEPSLVLDKHQEALKKLTSRIAEINDQENKLMTQGRGWRGQHSGDPTR